MSFKEQVKADIENVFLNLEEFAETHRIEGKHISIVIDNDQLVKLKQGQILGLVEADILVMGKRSDFPEDMEPGRLLNVDGREMIVTNSGTDMGLIEAALRQNRTA